MDAADVKRLLKIKDFKEFSEQLFALFPGKQRITFADMPPELQEHFNELYRKEDPGCCISQLRQFRRQLYSG